MGTSCGADAKKHLDSSPLRGARRNDRHFLGNLFWHGVVTVAVEVILRYVIVW